MSEQPAQHPYPSRYGRGEHWAIDEAWDILDSLPVGMLPDDERFLAAGRIAGALMRVAGMTFTVKELAILIEALAMAASRHEAQARSLKPGFSAAEHDERATLMRRLRARLTSPHATKESENGHG